MLKQDETTPIQMILSQNPDDPRNTRYVSEFISLRPIGMSSIQFHKQRLGKQKYCFMGLVKYWVWEGKNWRASVSKRGLSFEVLPALSIDEAWEAWQEYRSLMGK